MLIKELGTATTILLGGTLGFVSFAILIFWIQLFSDSFDSESRWFWPLFVVHILAWCVGTCVVPSDWLNDSFSTWAWPFMIYFFGSLTVMALVRIFKNK